MCIPYIFHYKRFREEDASIETEENMITPMKNFDPLEWKHVFVNLEKIDSLAKELSKSDQLKIPDWAEVLPQGLNMEESVEYILGLISIDFCHWSLKNTPERKCVWDFYSKNDQDENVRGSAAMSALAKKAYQKGIKIFDANFMQQVTADGLRPYFTGFDIEGNAMEIPALEKRVQVMNEIGRILQEKWSGSFYRIFKASRAHAFNKGSGFVELLVSDFPRFRDEYTYRDKKIGVYKLAQLAVMALQSSLRIYEDFQPFKDCRALTLCADYQLPRSLRALGILEYDPELAKTVDREELIPAGCPFEIELRMATVFAGWQLKEKINDSLAEIGKPLITSQELDYVLWSHGRQMDRNSSKHHLTRTIMY